MSGANTRRRRLHLFLSWVLSAALAAGLILLNGGLLRRLGVAPVAQLGLLLVMAGGLVAVQVLYWRALDEVARAVHAAAFFWSGLITWIVLTVGLSAVLILDPQRESLRGISGVDGAIAVMLVHGLLYLALWGFGRLRLR